MRVFDMNRKKLWKIKPPDPALQHILSRELSVSPLMAQILVNRGIYTTRSARRFLDPSLDRLYRPQLMKDLQRAVEVTLNALSSGQKILIYGDYDADGVTGTALLVEVLENLGGRVGFYIPNRLREGYGLHEEALVSAWVDGYGLIITVDCGIAAVEVVERLRVRGGPAIIITDHHEPAEEFPPADAVINPRRHDCSYPFKDLAGVGVAFKFAQALVKTAGEEDSLWQNLLDLVCLGTVADVVPLIGENRVLVKHGLALLERARRPGLQALVDVCGIGDIAIGTREIGYILAPCINAVGRLGDASLAVRLLLSHSYDLARQMATRLYQNNLERQRIEALVVSDAMRMVESDRSLLGDYVLVLAAEGWHPGVLGIAASRLAEHFCRPTVLIALDGETGRGSARSVPGFHLYRALEYCRHYLRQFGGHEQAAGLTIERDKLALFRRAINEYAARHVAEDCLIPWLDLEAVVKLQDVSPEMIEEIGKLYPYGHGNPPPLLACREARLVGWREAGENGTHLKITVHTGSQEIDGIGFNMGAYREILAAVKELNLAFVPTLNEWNGRVAPELVVEDFCHPTGGVLEIGREDKELPFLYRRIARALYDSDWLPFTPEFVASKLAEYGILNGEVAVVAGSTRVPVEEYLSSHHVSVEILDARDSVDKEAFLVDLARREGPLVVVVGSAHRSLEVARFIAAVLTGCKKRVGFLNGLFSVEDRELVANNFLSGMLEVMVTTPSFLSSLIRPDLSGIVLYYVPYDIGEWVQVASLAARTGAKIYMGCDTEDLTEGVEYVRAMGPDRDVLAHIYSYLRTLAGGGSGELELAGAVAALWKSGFRWAKEYTLLVALAIFRELNLIDVGVGRNGWCFKLLMAPGRKSNLAFSSTYSRVSAVRSGCEQWMQGFWQTRWGTKCRSKILSSG